MRFLPQPAVEGVSLPHDCPGLRRAEHFAVVSELVEVALFVNSEPTPRNFKTAWPSLLQRLHRVDALEERRVFCEGQNLPVKLPAIQKCERAQNLRLTDSTSAFDGMGLVR